jgi:hypothetical protein
VRLKYLVSAIVLTLVLVVLAFTADGMRKYNLSLNEIQQTNNHISYLN